MYPSYSAALLAATRLFGEGWFATRTIIPRYIPTPTGNYLVSGYLVSTKSPSRAAFRIHPGHQSPVPRKDQ
jgi:hypothetical protein